MSAQRESVKEYEAIEAWHFLPEDRRTRGGRGKEVTAGLKLSVKRPLVLCEHGLHASERAIDALRYAPGPIVCRVKIWGEVVHGEDKLCGQHRLVMWVADATEILHRFVCSIVTEAIDLAASRGCEVDVRSREAISVKLRWLAGGATNKELNMAEAAAWDAVVDADLGDESWDVARAAAKAAARDPVRDADIAAAWATSKAAAEAWATARESAWDTVAAAINRRLESMLLSSQVESDDKSQ